MWLVARFLVACTSVAAIDVCLHKACETREIVVVSEEINGLGLTKVTCSGRVVNLLEKFNLEIIVIGDIEEVGKVYEVVDHVIWFEFLLECWRT